MADFSPENAQTQRSQVNTRMQRPGGPPPIDNRSYPPGYADKPVSRRQAATLGLKGLFIGGVGLALGKVGHDYLLATEDRGQLNDSLVGKPRDKKLVDQLKDPKFDPNKRLFSNPRRDGKSIFRSGPYQDEDKSRLSDEELKKRGIDPLHELPTIDVYGVTYNTDPRNASLGNSTVRDEKGKDLGQYGSWQEVVQKDKDGKWKRAGVFVPDIYISHALDNAKK